MQGRYLDILVNNNSTVLETLCELIKIDFEVLNNYFFHVHIPQEPSDFIPPKEFRKLEEAELGGCG